MKLKLMAAFVVLAAGGAAVVGVLGGGEKPTAVTAEADSIKVIEGECPSSTVARLEGQIITAQQDHKAVMDDYLAAAKGKTPEEAAPLEATYRESLERYNAQTDGLRTQIRVIQQAAKCKGSYEKDGMCFCITDTKDPDGEVFEKDAPRGKVKRLWVCPDAKDPKKPATVRWDTDADVAPVGCTIAAKALTDTSMGSYDSDLVEQLRAFCSPCPVTGDSWSVCPRCGIGEPGKTDCATLCKVTAEPK